MEVGAERKAAAWDSHTTRPSARASWSATCTAGQQEPKCTYTFSLNFFYTRVTCDYEFLATTRNLSTSFSPSCVFVSQTS